MDMLRVNRSDMEKENPSTNNRQTSSSSSSQRHLSQASRKQTSSSVPKRDEDRQSTSRPPSIFNNKRRRSSDEYQNDQEWKKEKCDNTFSHKETLKVQTNQYEVDLSKMPEIVERFHLDIIASTEGKTMAVNGEVGVTGELAKQYRRWALWNIWKRMIEKNPNLFKKKIDYHQGVFDCGSSAYFEADVYDGGDEKAIELKRSDFNDVEWKPISMLLRREIKVITVIIVRNKGSGYIHTRGVNFLRPENRCELIRFLEILTSQYTNSRHYFQFGNTTFIRSTDENNELNTEPISEEGKELKVGFEKTMKLVQDKHGKARVLMTIDTRRCPFYQEQSVLEMLKAIYNMKRGGGGGNQGGNRSGGAFRGGYGQGFQRNRFNEGGQRRDDDNRRDHQRYDRDRQGNNGRDHHRRHDERRDDRGEGQGRHNGDDRGRHGNRRDDRDHHYGGDGQGRHHNDGDRRRHEDRRDDQDHRGDGEENNNGRRNEEPRNERRPERDDGRRDHDIENIIRAIRNEGEERTSRKLNELKSVAVNPKHLPPTKLNLFFIHGFVHQTAHQFLVPFEGNNIPMIEYYRNRYNITLKYPELPLAGQRKGSGMICYPLELLTIERGQRVKQQHITQNTQRKLTGMLPIHHIKKTQNVLIEELRINETQPNFLRNFGVHIYDRPTTLTASILSAPDLKFDGSSKYQPKTGCRQKPSMSSQNSRFEKPAKLIEIQIINFDEALNRQSAGKLCYVIEKACEDQNITFSTRSKHWEIISCNESDHQKLENIMNDAKKRKISLLFAVTREQRPDVHDVLKLFESQIGIQTQHVSMKTANTMMGTNGRQTMENVIRKFNVKCGGLNFSVSVPKSICDDHQGVQKMFFDNTLLIGFELAHAGATCLFDRQNNIACGEPSVVGYSYSCGGPCELGGYSYLQKPREHSLMYLPKHMSMILANYLFVNKKLPEKVVIYRSGVGEGDFEKVAGEVEQMKSVFETDEHFKGKPVPKFLMVVVSKTTHQRIYPKELTGGKSFDQNVPSGTCLTSEITTYGLNEFYLISQTAVIGTTRPARYTVIVNDLKWSLNEISHLTYFLAFGHQVSFQPPGVPNVLYAAENMAKRGRTNSKTYQKLMRAGRGDRNDAIEDDVNGTKMDQLSSQLNRCAINCKNFWA